jgi:flagella basal body P-ring formation protein FlgA
LQHFPNLEHVDPIKLLAVETEQQQLKAILPYQLRALVYRIHYTSHAPTPTQRLSVLRRAVIKKRHGACFLTLMNTEPTFFRRLTSIARQWLCAISAVCLLSAGSPALADAVTLPDMLIGITQGFLEFTVEDYLASSRTEGRYEIQVNQLDPRLRMPMCDKELTATLESPAIPIGRVTVKVRCDSTAPWTVFVPAQVRLFRDVVTTTRPLKRAGVIEPGDVMLRERDISLISQGYFTSMDQAIGQKLTRPTVTDQVLTQVHLEQAEVITKGDQVVITARSGTLSVRMPGEALSNGGIREQIRVKNLNSQRVIKAQVIAPGQVEVAM